MAQANSNDKPIIVHCSAGLGRTGSFILVDSILKKVQDECKKGKKEEEIEINLPATLMKMRSSRPLLVQTEVKRILSITLLYSISFLKKQEQYEFCYLAIYDGVKKIMKGHSVEFKRKTLGHYVKRDSLRAELAD